MKIRHALSPLVLGTALCLTTHLIPTAAFAKGCQGQCEDDNGDNNGNGNGNGNRSTPTPTPVVSPTPSATPVATPPAVANPLTDGAAADQTSADNRFVTVELETIAPNYTNRGFISTGCTINALAHFDARLATFRGYYEGSARNPVPSGTPPTTQPISDPSRLTQALPSPTAAPSPTPPPPDQRPRKQRKPKTARQWANDGNDRNGEHDGRD